MRYSSGHKEQTRARILQAAGRLFRRLGCHAAGVDQVMKEAGLTAGGFYAHFRSKEELLAEMLPCAAAEAGAALAAGTEAPPAGPARIDAFLERYLSPSHREGAERGCPLAALVSEIARTGGPVKTRFETVVRDLARQVKEQGGDEMTEDRALAIIALCVGGLGLSRAVHDQALGERILAASHALARAAGTEEATPTRSPGPR